MTYFGTERGWHLKGPLASGKTTLFRWEALAKRPFDKVLLAEGEKTTIAAQKLFPDYVCVTWSGGAGRLAKVDWSPLSGRHITYWPDADDAGEKTVLPIQRALGVVCAASMRVVKCMGEMPRKWDLADPCPEGKNLKAMLVDATLLDLSLLKELLELSYNDLSEGWFYIVETDEFFHKPTGLQIAKQQFGSMYRHLPEAQRGSVANRFLEDFRDNKLVMRVYRPGIADEIVTTEDGIRALNSWRPSKVQRTEGDADLFVKHLRYLTGRDEDFEHLADMLAFIVQKPGVKLKSAPIIVGRQGTGKSYVGDVMRMLVGDHNCTMIETHELRSDFNAFMEGNVLVILEELMALGRRDVLNSLKPKITQLTIQINKKYANMREIPNTVNFIAFTNHANALPLDRDDRRYFVVGTEDVVKRDADYYDGLWLWTSKNYGVVLNWLLDRDLSAFAPDAPPPQTAAKIEMTEMARPIVEIEIARMIIDGEAPFDLDLVEAKVVLKTLSDNIREANLSSVLKGLKANGARNLGQKKMVGRGHERKVSLWVVRNVESWISKPSAAVARAYFERLSAADDTGGPNQLFAQD